MLRLGDEAIMRYDAYYRVEFYDAPYADLSNYMLMLAFSLSLA
jgi:hypothetical protein